ncbi:SDR family oxidoreductase [Sphingobium sufflavum]|uniref:SDR family NAD(P)-dependent oxidoreductase n=1 Tax=Sphingobium sufflavum TaxID=1129547 RepID=UPI001F35952A|nr:SDR family NAD(P)-dependent oxidoreductase [Sphingobium sufflavum]MCE7797160.1 SDR family oxidoreductase [Sphingobium sufflavum]
MSKTALVTGAAAGIGRACAIRLAKDGHAVGVLDLDLNGAEAVAAEIVAAGGRAFALQASIADRAQVTAAVDRLRAGFGPVTILVNNAGISKFVDFEDITDDLWDEQFTINAKGTFIVTQVVLPDMKAATWGRIVNISSSSAQTGSIQQVHYSASKGAVITMTRSLAQALGPLGITVNNIPPGSVLGTIMSDKNISKATIDNLNQTLPVRRVGEPNDIANACAWLCLEDSGYVTGQTIGVNGGRVVS